MTARNGSQGDPDAPDDDRAAPGASDRVSTLRAVTVGALLTIAAGLVLDAAPGMTSDQRLVAAGVAALLAAILGLSSLGYRRGR